MLRYSLLLPLLFVQGCLYPVKAVIENHKEATKWDGPRCPMYPSCSSWGEHAIEEHGWAGLFLTVDRLFYREGGRLAEKYTVAPRRLSRHRRYYDPVEDSFGQSEPSLFSVEVSE